MFSSLMDSLGRQAVSLFMRAEIVQRQPVPETKVEKMQTSHQDASAYDQTPPQSPTAKGPQHPSAGQPVQRDVEKVGRNDDCPCGSGKKYKKCCGK